MVDSESAERASRSPVQIPERRSVVVSSTYTHVDYDMLY